MSLYKSKPDLVPFYTSKTLQINSATKKYVSGTEQEFDHCDIIIDCVNAKKLIDFLKEALSDQNTTLNIKKYGIKIHLKPKTIKKYTERDIYNTNLQIKTLEGEIKTLEGEIKTLEGEIKTLVENTAFSKKKIDLEKKQKELINLNISNAEYKKMKKHARDETIEFNPKEYIVQHVQYPESIIDSYHIQNPSNTDDYSYFTYGYGIKYNFSDLCIVNSVDGYKLSYYGCISSSNYWSTIKKSLGPKNTGGYNNDNNSSISTSSLC